jgi:hypothetical protein
MSKTKKTRPTEERVKKYFRFRDLGKHAYEAADELLELLVASRALKVNKPLPMPDGTRVVLRDLYPKGTMKVFRAHGIGRYELAPLSSRADLEVVKPPAAKGKKKGK